MSHVQYRAGNIIEHTIDVPPGPLRHTRVDQCGAPDDGSVLPILVSFVRVEDSLQPGGSVTATVYVSSVSLVLVLFQYKHDVLQYKHCHLQYKYDSPSSINIYLRPCISQCRGDGLVTVADPVCII